MSERFEQLFGRAEEIVASAPGRVNLIGEHTDYNGGLVLPMPIPLETHVRMARRTDARVTAHSLEIAPDKERGHESAQDSAQESYVLGAETPCHRWIDYVQGVTAVLRAGGHAIGGFDALVGSEVPVGKGLASSAALEVSVARALRQAFGLRLSDEDIAKACHRAETEFVGAPVGIMDQIACSVGRAHELLFLDAHLLTYEYVSLPDAAAVGIIDSGIAHQHASGQYRLRRAECDKAAQLLGVALLRELSESDTQRIASLPAPLDRRVRHVMTENARVRQMVDALRAGDLEQCGRLLAMSHASMRDDFEISLPEIDRLVEIASASRDIYGARMTGGGFGGAVLVLGRRESIGVVADEITARYHAETGRPGARLVPAPPRYVS